MTTTFHRWNLMTLALATLLTAGCGPSPSDCGEEDELRVVNGACGTLTRVDRPGTSIESTLEAIRGEIDEQMESWGIEEYRVETRELTAESSTGEPDPRSFVLVQIYHADSELLIIGSFAVIASDGTRYNLNWCPD